MKEESLLFTRRAFILGGIKSFLMMTIIGKLYYLQIRTGEYYKTLSDKNRIHTQFLSPKRGRIFDRNDRVLASNSNAFSVFIVNSCIENKEKLVLDLSKILKLSIDDHERIFSDLNQYPEYLPVFVKGNLTWHEMSFLQIFLPDLSGVIIEEEYYRIYKEPLSLSHIIGYIGFPNESEINRRLSMGLLPRLKIGKIGLEKSYNVKLMGVASIKQFEVNSKRQVIREIAFLPGKDGEDIKTTINLEYQNKAYELLKPYRSGAIILLECHSGAVRAMVSYPGFDINAFSRKIYQKDWKVLNNDQHRPLISKAHSGQYAPGSTFKIIVSLAALESKIIDLNDFIHCYGFTDLGNHRFHCWKKDGHGRVNIHLALMYSCDIYFFHIASVIGINSIVSMSKRFGLGSLTGLDIPGEKRGLLPSKEWKKHRLKQSWHIGDTYNIGIGQGYILTTPIQLAVMISILANNGNLIYPYIYEKRSDPLNLNIRKESLEKVIYGLYLCVNEEGGTGFSAKISQKKLEMIGKTGTSQVKRITKRERELGIINSLNRPWELKEHALFVGYAPSYRPYFSICVLIEHGGSGKSAASVAKDLLVFCQEHEVKNIKNEN